MNIESSTDQTVRHWVLLGALFVVATQAFQPFVQQAVTYPIRLQRSGMSTCTRGVAFQEVDGLPSNSMSTFECRQISFTLSDLQSLR